METAKERLKGKLDSLTKEAKNMKILNEYFGEENLKRLPFGLVSFKFSENSWDGTWVATVNLKTGKIETSCTVAGGEDEQLKEGHYFLKKIETEIFNELEKVA